MAILINENTKVIVQGITGREGSRHTQYMLQYGTKILAGVTPGKSGQMCRVYLYLTQLRKPLGNSQT